MVFRKAKTYLLNKKWVGKKRKHEITIIYDMNKCKYHFVITEKDSGYCFDSLEKFKPFNSMLECCEEGERYLDEKILGK